MCDQNIIVNDIVVCVISIIISIIIIGNDYDELFLVIGEMTPLLLIPYYYCEGIEMTVCGIDDTVIIVDGQKEKCNY